MKIHGHSTYEPQSGFTRWLDKRLPIIRLTHDSFVAYPTPRNLNYWWTFGAMLALCLVVQIVSGIVLAMHYIPHVNFAFASVQRSWGLVTLEGIRNGRVAVNNANTEWADGYYLLNARLAFRTSTRLSMEPVVGVENIFDKTWASNVVVNANAGRYYEPGPGRTYYIGIRMGTR